jgi:hypothetical protein
MKLPNFLIETGGTLDENGFAIFSRSAHQQSESSLRKIPLLDWNIINVAGPDARSFLQAQLASDLGLVSAQSGQLSAWCSPAGRVLFCFYLLAHAEGLLLMIPNGRGAELEKRLRMYVLRARATIADQTDRWFLAGVCGAGEAVRRHTLSRHSNTLCLAVSDQGRALCLVPAADAAAWWSVHPAVPAAGAEWLLRDIEDGLPVTSRAKPDQFLPQMLNLDLLGGVSFNKGCYPGQEVIARMKYRGRVKRRLQRFELAAADTPAPDTPIYLQDDDSGNTAGSIINAARSANGLHAVLAVAQLDPERPLCAFRPNGPVLTLRALPYEIPAS